MTLQETAALRVEGLVKEFPGVRAVDCVDLEVGRGEVHGLLGGNGAGKSTLIKIISGVIRPDAGAFYVSGTKASFGSAQEAHEAGISVLHQELSLVPYFSAAENIFLGRKPPTNRFGLIDWRALRGKAKEVLDLLEVRIPLDAPVSELSPAMQTMVAIARAISLKASILVLDEPTASLTDQETEHLFEVLRTLKGRGVSILYVTHRLDEFFKIADRITVMRDGRNVATRHLSETTVGELIGLMVGKSLDQVFPEKPEPVAEPLMEVSGLTGSKIRDLSFVLHKGEVLGIAGLAGSGRSETLRLLYGAQRRGKGTVLLEGRPVSPSSPGGSLRAGIALVPEERRSQGLVLNRSVVENLTLPHLRSFSSFGVFVRRERELAAAEELRKKLGIKTANFDQNVGQLSGGNQQKVVLGKCIAVGDVRVLLLDEPTRGVDVEAKAEIYRIVRELANEGCGVLLVSSELPELIGLSDRIVVLVGGAATATLKADDIDQEELLNYCYGRISA